MGQIVLIPFLFLDLDAFHLVKSFRVDIQKMPGGIIQCDYASIVPAPASPMRSTISVRLIAYLQDKAWISIKDVVGPIRRLELVDLLATR